MQEYGDKSRMHGLLEADDISTLPLSAEFDTEAGLWGERRFQ
jgi:hypothetical protein